MTIVYLYFLRNIKDIEKKKIEKDDGVKEKKCDK